MDIEITVGKIADKRFFAKDARTADRRVDHLRREWRVEHVVVTDWLDGYMVWWLREEEHR